MRANDLEILLKLLQYELVASVETVG